MDRRDESHEAQFHYLPIPWHVRYLTTASSQIENNDFVGLSLRKQEQGTHEVEVEKREEEQETK